MSRGHFIGLNHHRLMLADRVRMEAYERAIEARVRPGMRVLDLGTGTGILALWAARAGAQVVAVEPHDVVHVARRLAAANGLADRIRFVQADSRALELAEPVELVVTECMGNFFVTDEMQPVLRDLPRLMAPGGETMPRRISLHVGAATLPTWRELAFWDEPVGGLDFTAARDFASQAAYVLHVEPELMVSPAVTAASFGLVEAPDTFALEVVLPVGRALPVQALVGWFVADLGAGVELSTAPGNRTHWGQMVFPLPATRVRKGDVIEARLELGMDERGQGHYRWAGWIRRPDHPAGDVPFDRDTRRRFEGPREV